MNAGCNYQEDDGTRRDRQVGTGGRMSRSSLIRREKREGGWDGLEVGKLERNEGLCGTEVYLWDVGLKIGVNFEKGSVGFERNHASQLSNGK